MNQFIFAVTFLSAGLFVAGEVSAQYYSAQQYVQQYERACLNGDGGACQELYTYANGQCQRRDNSACAYVRTMEQYFGQAERGYGQQPGDYPPQQQPSRMYNDLDQDQHNLSSAATPAPIATAPATVKSGAGEQDLHALEERVKGIETIGFYTRTEMGAGGYFNFVPAPMVLFKSGDALRDMKQLADPAGLEANKSAHASAWTKWRRNGGVLESLESNNTWKKLPYPKTYDRLAKGFKLSGRYTRLSGTGNVAFGGGSSVTAWSELVFDRNGTFRTSDGGSASSVDASSSAFATGTHPEEGGTYEIEGYVLTLRYADGHAVYRMITTDASDPKAIWLDGFSYTQ